MLLYEVNMEVSESINYKVAGWLTEHLQIMLKRKGFQALQWFFRLPQDEQREQDNKTLWTLQYLVEDRACLDEYLAHEGETIDELKTKFGEDVHVSRRVLNLLRVAGPAYENFPELKPEG
jgi:hypothetical protein